MLSPKKVVHMVLGIAMVIAGLTFMVNLTRAVISPQNLKEGLRRQAMLSLWITVAIVAVYIAWLVIIWVAGF